MSKSTYTKREFDAFCRTQRINQLRLYSFIDSNGQECLTTINEDQDYGQKLNYLSRFIQNAETTAGTVRKLISRQKKHSKE